MIIVCFVFSHLCFVFWFNAVSGVCTGPGGYRCACFHALLENPFGPGKWLRPSGLLRQVGASAPTDQSTH